MVKKSGWSDKQLEAWLRDMPKIEDHRDPRDIYQNINSKINKKKQRVWLMPSIATVATFAIIFIFVSNQFNFSQSSQSADKVEKNTGLKEVTDQNSPEKSKIEEATDINSMNATEENIEDKEKSAMIEDEQEANIQHSKLLATNAVSNSVYKEDLNNNDLLTYFIPDKNSEVLIPINVLVPKTEGSQHEKWHETMDKLEEEKWGLNDYYPLAAEVEIDQKNNALNIDVKPNHQYNYGSTSEIVFQDVLRNLATVFNMNKVSLFTEGKPGIEFGNSGIKYELSPLPSNKLAYYVFYPEASEELYLVPENGQFSTFEQAIDSMENPRDSKLQASIPENVKIGKIQPSEDKVIIQLEEGTELNNDSLSNQAIEAILLSAKSFGYKKVKFENSKVEKVGDFILSEFIDVPIAANKKIIDE